MKIKDLPDNINLGSVIVRTPEGKIGYWKSQWNKGIWLSNGKDDRIHPVFVSSIQDALEWEVIEDENLINI